MSKNEKKELEVKFEELKQPEDSEKIGEVCLADTNSCICIKIKNRPDDLKLGQPVAIDTDKFLYYCMITRLFYPPNDVATKFANSPLTNLIPPDRIDGVRGKEFFGLADMNCLKILSADSESMQEFDTIPPIFSKGRNITEKEIDRIYATSDTTDSVGTLRGFQYEIPIDFGKLVKKPFGVFGRTGIGKSILNKLICLYILKHKVSQLLLFDMQGEYGIVSRAEDKSKGLKFYFNEDVQIYRLGELKEKISDDAEPFFFYKENISSGDIIASTQTLREPTINVLLTLERSIPNGSNIIDQINDYDGNIPGITKNSVNALRNRISRFEDYKFLVKKGKKDKIDSISHIFNQLKLGKSIVIDFGPYGTNKHLYYFVANAITRRLYELYSNKEFTDEKLPPLVVVLEEAHKFLKPDIIGHTIFDRIAREMRKFQLTLSFVDQRPSQIDEEVLSQIATRFILHMTDTKDIDKVVGNLKNPSEWRGIISGLQKQQCLVYGDAISVPTILDIKDYNDISAIKKSLNIENTLTEDLQKIDKENMTELFPND